MVKVTSSKKSRSFKFLNTCTRKKGMLTNVEICLQEGSIARASCCLTRPGTASNAAADPRAASSARRGTVSPFDPRYQLHRVYRTRRTAISKCSTLRGTEGSTRAFKAPDRLAHDRRLFEMKREIPF